MPIELQTMACLSTAHVSPETGMELDLLIKLPVPLAARANPDIWQGQILVSAWSEYGWLIWVDSPRRAIMPADLRACLDLAQTAGADWLLLDRDCAPIEELPLHNW